MGKVVKDTVVVKTDPIDPPPKEALSPAPERAPPMDPMPAVSRKEPEPVAAPTEFTIDIVRTLGAEISHVPSCGITLITHSRVAAASNLQQRGWSRQTGGGSRLYHQ